MALNYDDMTFLDYITGTIVSYITPLKDKIKMAILKILATTIDELINNKNTHA